MDIARENLTLAEILLENELRRAYSMYSHLVNKGLVEELYAKYIAKAYNLKLIWCFLQEYSARKLLDEAHGYTSVPGCGEPTHNTP